MERANGRRYCVFEGFGREALEDLVNLALEEDPHATLVGGLNVTKSGMYAQAVLFGGLNNHSTPTTTTATRPLPRVGAVSSAVIASSPLRPESHHQHNHHLDGNGAGNGGNGGGKFSRACYVCNQPGHTSFNCPNRSTTSIPVNARGGSTSSSAITITREDTEREEDASLLSNYTSSPLLKNLLQPVLFQVPESKVGVLIGKYGYVIKKLREKTGATIDVPMVRSADGIKRIQVFGPTKEVIDNAIREMNLLLNAKPVSAKQVPPPPNNSTIQRGYYKEGEGGEESGFDYVED